MFLGFTGKERHKALLLRFTREDRMVYMKKLKSTRVYLLLIAILGVLAVAGCVLPATGADVIAPTVDLVSPANLAASAVINTKLVATFSEAMDPATISTTNFTVAHGSTAVPGVVSYAGTSATFTPTSVLLGGTPYTATITTGVKDVAGNAMASSYAWSFTTTTNLDITKPTVGSPLPLPAAVAVAVNAHVSVIFSEVMDPLTMTTANFTLKQGTTAVTGTVASVGNTLTFTPAANLGNSLVYTATITTGVKDLAGNAMATAYAWTFTTSALIDIIAPTVTLKVPASGAVTVDRNANVTATFSEAMAPLTINTTTFTLKQGTTPVTGTVIYAGTTATFNPAIVLAGSTVYTATISTGAKDIAGNAIALTTWNFTTTAAGIGPAPVLLGTAGNFATLAKSAITNATLGASLITGNIGLSPAAESYIAGFALTDATGYATTPEVTLKVFAADQAPPTPANMTAAISDMELAYTDAAGRVTPDYINLGSGTIGASTPALAPGLYTWGSSVNMTGNITINGSANDVWIFQMSGDFLVDNAVIVTLAGGAQAKNIFWQVAGQATLGGTSAVKGNILSQTGITLQTGATLLGRALAQTQVALQSAFVTTP